MIFLKLGLISVWQYIKIFANHFYIPENWDPYCTLAIRHSTEQIIEVMKYRYKDFIPHRSKIVEVALIKLDFDTNGKCKSSPTIILNVLKQT